MRNLLLSSINMAAMTSIATQELSLDVCAEACIPLWLSRFQFIPPKIIRTNQEFCNI